MPEGFIDTVFYQVIITFSNVGFPTSLINRLSGKDQTPD